MSNIEAIGLGALNIDQLYRVERILEDGETVVEEARSFSGGSAANTIHGLAKLGISTGFTGVVGDDAEGKMLLLNFQKVGVDTSQIKVKPKVKTGLVLSISDKLGRRSLYVLPGANSLMSISDLNLAYINQTRTLHLSSFADGRQFKVAVELVKSLDSSVKVSFAPGALFTAKGFKALAPILARVEVLFINQNELQQLTGQGLGAGAETCLRQGCHIIVVTSGIKGSYIRDTENEHIVKPPGQNAPIVLDTTGAGDAFAAGFLYGLLKEKGVEECGKLGDIVARFAISKLGARQGLPTFDQLSQRYQELYTKQL